MKEYPKTYEDTYSRPRAVNKCKLEHVTTDIGLSAKEYRELSRKCLEKIMARTFQSIIEFAWLQHRFVYMGYRRKKTGGNFFLVDGAFGVFMRHHVGIEYRTFSRNFMYGHIVPYLPELFPKFHEINPFENPEYYKYPYKHVTLDYLTIVGQMTNRLELLQIAEDRKMMWDEFFDYVVNYSLCYNDEHKNNLYTVINPSSICPPYIRNNLKNRNNSSRTKK